MSTPRNRRARRNWIAGGALSALVGVTAFANVGASAQPAPVRDSTPGPRRQTDTTVYGGNGGDARRTGSESRRVRERPQRRSRRSRTGRPPRLHASWLRHPGDLGRSVQRRPYPAFRRQPCHRRASGSFRPPGRVARPRSRWRRCLSSPVERRSRSAAGRERPWWFGAAQRYGARSSSVAHSRRLTRTNSQSIAGTALIAANPNVTTRPISVERAPAAAPHRRRELRGLEPGPAQHDAQLGIPLHLNHDLDVWGLRA